MYFLIHMHWPPFIVLHLAQCFMQNSYPKFKTYPNHPNTCNYEKKKIVTLIFPAKVKLTKNCETNHCQYVPNTISHIGLYICNKTQIRNDPQKGVNIK